MAIYLINGSPRKRGNTAELLDEAARGAVAGGGEPERIDLYGIDFKGCASCFVCKRLGGKSFRRCARRDGLTPVLDKLARAEGIILGTPLYFMGESAGVRALLERLLFPLTSYAPDAGDLPPRRIPAGLIYTMNMTREQFEASSANGLVAATTGFVESCLGHKPEVLLSYDTYQFDDYDKYESSYFDEGAKKRRRAEQFPRDRDAAYRMGLSIASVSISGDGRRPMPTRE